MLAGCAAGAQMLQGPRARTRNRRRAHSPGEAVAARLRAGGAHRAERESTVRTWALWKQADMAEQLSRRVQ
eukprot:10146286-Alexandrium_andersonii.AAC.1